MTKIIDFILNYFTYLLGLRLVVYFSYSRGIMTNLGFFA